MPALKQALAVGYSRFATAYDLLAEPLYLEGFRRLLPMVNLPPNPAILDVGCGTGGVLLEAMRRLGPCRAAVGIDISPGMVQAAALKARRQGLPAAFAVADAEALPLPAAVFDLVICTACFHWLRDRQRALAEMRRVMRPGGQLMLTSAVTPCFVEWFAMVQAALAARMSPAALRTVPALPHAADVLSALQQARLEISFFQTQRMVLPVHNPESFAAVVTAAAPHWTAKLSAEEVAAIQRDVAATARYFYPQGLPCTWAGAGAVARRPLLPPV